MQLNTIQQLQLMANVWTKEIAHVLCVMPHDGAMVVPVKTYIEVVMITTISSWMVLKAGVFYDNGYKEEEH